MPEALGAPPPPPAPAYGSPPQYPAAAQNFAPIGYGIPPPPPPPPPGMGMPDFGIPRPQSGKAVGSLVCAGLGLICCAIALPIGFVLGCMGIAETGPNGSRSGRGMAITGLVLNTLIMGGIIAFYVVVFAASAVQHQKQQEVENKGIDADLDKIRLRLNEYYVANNNSLGAGGFKLASTEKPTTTVKTPVKKGRVEGTLKMEDLFAEGELSMPLNMYELIITGSSSATVRASSWTRNTSRVMKIYDISVTNSYSISDE
jgi:hypothetical protein